MSVRVELIDEVIVDLADQAESGNLKQFFKKLLEIETNGSQAGEPLGRDLVGWRKITVGNRNWRIVFRVDKGESVATVCVVGDREDAARYEEAQRRAQEADPGLAIGADKLGRHGRAGYFDAVRSGCKGRLADL